MKKITIAITGASGRMGKMLLEATLNSDGFDLVAALDQENSPAIGRTVGELIGQTSQVKITSALETAITACDCLIDFTRPQATLEHLEVCEKYGKAIVIGTTGFADVDKEKIEQTAKKIPIVFAPNMAVGVNLVFKLLDTAARILADGYDIEIIEAHHRHKVDAPSGTALRMGEIVAQALARDLKECSVYSRENIKKERDSTTIGFSTIRGGDIVGDHNVMFCGQGERIEIVHKASSRIPYALGSLRAARFLSSKQNGLYDMQDVLGLR